jgi:hypothetical protein
LPGQGLARTLTIKQPPKRRTLASFELFRLAP